MALVLTEEQELLQETAREFVREHSPLAELRKLRDSQAADGFSRDLWKQAADLGWAGILFPEELGGAGLGYAELGVVLEEAGRTLMAHPLVSTVLLAGNAILLAGSEAQKKDVLPAVAAGERLLAFAYQESLRHAPHLVETRAEATADGFRLTGAKRFVLDGHVADQLVVLARTAGSAREREGLSLFLVDAGAPGLEITRTNMVDSRNAAQVRLDGVRVERTALIGAAGTAGELCESLFDRAAIGLSAEMLGSCQEAFDRTLQYLKTRVQFGVPIGSFQALKHRATQMFCEVELARSAVLEGLRAIDAGRAELPELASLVKARCSDTFLHVAREAIQLHGGIGMTDEEEIGFFLKRAMAVNLLLGDGAFHRERYARLRGF